MKLLLDTHVLIWAAGLPDRIPVEGRDLIADTGNELFFSAASLWEVAIKSALGRDDFTVDARLRHAPGTRCQFVPLSIEGTA